VWMDQKAALAAALNPATRKKLEATHGKHALVNEYVCLKVKRVKTAAPIACNEDDPTWAGHLEAAARVGRFEDSDVGTTIKIVEKADHHGLGKIMHDGVEYEVKWEKGPTNGVSEQKIKSADAWKKKVNLQNGDIFINPRLPMTAWQVNQFPPECGDCTQDNPGIDDAGYACDSNVVHYGQKGLLEPWVEGTSQRTCDIPNEEQGGPRADFFAQIGASSRSDFMRVQSGEPCKIKDCSGNPKKQVPMNYTWPRLRVSFWNGVIHRCMECDTWKDNFAQKYIGQIHQWLSMSWRRGTRNDGCSGDCTKNKCPSLAESEKKAPKIQKATFFQEKTCVNLIEKCRDAKSVELLSTSANTSGLMAMQRSKLDRLLNDVQMAGRYSRTTDCW